MLRCVGQFQTNLVLSVRAAADRGASAVEYSLLVALITAVIIGVVLILGQGVFVLFDSVPGF